MEIDIDIDMYIYTYIHIDTYIYMFIHIYTCRIDHGARDNTRSMSLDQAQSPSARIDKDQMLLNPYSPGPSPGRRSSPVLFATWVLEIACPEKARMLVLRFGMVLIIGLWLDSVSWHDMLNACRMTL